jgi:hypothetical protein
MEENPVPGPANSAYSYWFNYRAVLASCRYRAVSLFPRFLSLLLFFALGVLRAFFSCGLLRLGVHIAYVPPSAHSLVKTMRLASAFSPAGFDERN